MRPDKAALFGNETVLLVEDDAGVRVVLETMLLRHGYDVLTCATPEQALEICGRHPKVIHLAVTDIIMPRMSGRELADKLIALRPEIQVLYVSGYPETTSGEVVNSNTDYLQKPFTPEALGAKIREVLSRAPVAVEPRTPGV